MGPTSALTWAMYTDVADYGQYKYGRRSTGLVLSASLFSLKFGSTMAGFLGGWMLALFGFVPNQIQTGTALMGITLMFSIVPALFAVAKAISLWIYPLNRNKVLEIEQALAKRAGA